jgi:CheY-like chemotaxis protein
MALLITHTGQSGVERGADRAARTVGFEVDGFCTFEQRDELAVLPPEILADLTPCKQRGARSALRATLERASVLVIAVPDASEANRNAGVEALRRSARLAGVPHWVVDPLSDLDEIATKFRRMELFTDLRVMITGPRLTRWRDGERLGWRVVAQLSLAPAAVVRKHRVLVVDDHRDTAELTCELLRALGHECQAATSGVSGLEAAAGLKPDIALLDIGLPDLSGYELARRLRESQPQPLFLAAITGWDQAQDSRDAIAAGFDRHVIKPASVEVIRSLLGHAELQLAG